MSKFILNWIVHLCFKNSADGIKIYTSNMCIRPFPWDLQNLITQWCQRPAWNSSQTLTHRICSCNYVNFDGIILWIGPSNSIFTKWNSSDQDMLDSVNVYVSNYHSYMCRFLCFWYFRIIAVKCAIYTYRTLRYCLTKFLALAIMMRVKYRTQQNCY